MMNTPSRTLILASTSVYRAALLRRLGVPFETHAPGVDETELPGETPRQTAERLAHAKAMVVAERFPQAVVIGGDQLADLNGQALGKPGNHANAVAQLQSMRGQTVVFQTALCVLCVESGFQAQSLSPIRAQYRALSDAEIAAYLTAEQPYNCAGSTRSEGRGIALMEWIESDDPTALEGLPLIRLCAFLRQAGVRLF